MYVVSILEKDKNINKSKNKNKLLNCTLPNQKTIHGALYIVMTQVIHALTHFELFQILYDIQ